MPTPRSRDYRKLTRTELDEAIAEQMAGSETVPQPHAADPFGLDIDIESVQDTYTSAMRGSQIARETRISPHTVQAVGNTPSPRYDALGRRNAPFSDIFDVPQEYSARRVQLQPSTTRRILLTPPTTRALGRAPTPGPNQGKLEPPFSKEYIKKATKEFTPKAKERPTAWSRILEDEDAFDKDTPTKVVAPKSTRRLEPKSYEAVATICDSAHAFSNNVRCRIPYSQQIVDENETVFLKSGIVLRVQINPSDQTQLRRGSTILFRFEGLTKAGLPRHGMFLRTHTLSESDLDAAADEADRVFEDLLTHI